MQRTDTTTLEISAFKVTITKDQQGDPETFCTCHGKGEEEGMDPGTAQGIATALETMAGKVRQAAAQAAAPAVRPPPDPAAS